jgi:hypothetical protein
LGAGFVPSSVVVFRSRPVETKWDSSTELSAELAPEETAEPGNFLIQVVSPKPGGGVSGGLGFIIDYP